MTKNCHCANQERDFLETSANYSTFQKSLPKCNEAKLLEKTISRRSPVKAKADFRISARIGREPKMVVQLVIEAVVFRVEHTSHRHSSGNEIHYSKHIGSYLLLIRESPKKPLPKACGWYLADENLLPNNRQL